MMIPNLAFVQVPELVYGQMSRKNQITNMYSFKRFLEAINSIPLRYPSKQSFPLVIPMTALWLHHVTSGPLFRWYSFTTIRWIIYIYDIYISQFVPMKSVHWSMSLARAPVMSRMSPIHTSGGYRPLGFLEHLGAEEVSRKSLRNVTINCHRSHRSWFRLEESSNCNLSSHGWGKIHRNLIYLW